MVSRETRRNDLIIAFVSNCLRLYRVSILIDLDLPATERRPGDDAAILAALGLIQLYGQCTEYPSALLRAILILEILLLDSKHNYDAIVILIRLYMSYGAGSLAIQRYSSLSIKNMQHASLSWILYTRISTIHPHPVSVPTADGKSRTKIDPLEELRFADEWHRSARELGVKALGVMQDQGQWCMLLEALNLNGTLEMGFAKYLLMAESKHIRRFRASPHSMVLQPSEK